MAEVLDFFLVQLVALLLVLDERELRGALRAVALELDRADEGQALRKLALVRPGLNDSDGSHFLALLDGAQLQLDPLAQLALRDSPA